jgi:hypothetical protein
MPYSLWRACAQTLAVPSFEAFRERVGVSPFDDDQPLGNWCDGYSEPEKTICEKGLADPSVRQSHIPFEAARAAYRRTLSLVFKYRNIDALVYPQSVSVWPPNFSDIGNNETSVPEVNIAGVPGAKSISFHYLTLLLVPAKLAYGPAVMRIAARVLYAVALVWAAAGLNRSHAGRMRTTLQQTRLVTLARVPAQRCATSCDFAAVYVPSTRGNTSAGAPAPFSLAFIGLPYDEAKLLAFAYDYEQATQLRWIPELLSTFPPELQPPAEGSSS